MRPNLFYPSLSSARYTLCPLPINTWRVTREFDNTYFILFYYIDIFFSKIIERSWYTLKLCVSKTFVLFFHASSTLGKPNLSLCYFYKTTSSVDERGHCVTTRNKTNASITPPPRLSRRVFILILLLFLHSLGIPTTVAIVLSFRRAAAALE